MMSRGVYCLLAAVFLGVCVWSTNAAARRARPVYVDIHPVADSQAVFSNGLIAAMVRQSLSARDLSMIRMGGDRLPTGVLVLRVLYVIHRQNTTRGVVMAAAADVDLLRTRADRHDAVLATSIYSGVQQSLVQGDNPQDTKNLLRAQFKNQLSDRMDQAFAKESAYH